MKIEKLNTDKIRITLNFEDLKNNDIDIHTFMSNSTENQNLFLYILDLAEEQYGFSTDNYKVRIETMYLNNNSFILNITNVCSFVIAYSKSVDKANTLMFDVKNIINFLETEKSRCYFP